MIIYELECVLGHQFEGWFPSSKAFEEQLQEGLVHCAICGMGKVKQIPSGGHIAHSPAKTSERTSGRKPAPSKKKEEKEAREMMANIDPITLVKVVDHYVKTNFKNVGDQFAQKALDIHQGVAEKEPIYGTATPQEQERLIEKEIPFVSLPKLPESTEN